MARVSAEEHSRLVVGVTGHRFLADVKRVRKGVAEALKHVEKRFPGRSLRVVSSLAEGGDRIVVEEVLKKPGATLEVVLPMPREEYLRDFPDKNSRKEFEKLMQRAERVRELPLQKDRNASYEEAGLQVLVRSQVLFAIWDGKAEQGPGGTGEIVRLARARHLPIVWIHAGNRRPATDEPTSLGKAQGSVTFERI
jgi:hypothetical protein